MALRPRPKTIGGRQVKKRLFYYGLNFIAPGVGQLALGWWLKGALQLLTAILCSLGCIWEVVWPLYASIRNLINGTETNGETIVQLNFRSILLYIAILVAAWIWSYIDLALCYREPPKEEKPQ